VEEASIVEVASRFGVSRPTVYQAQAAFQQAGLSGLLPKHRGPMGSLALRPGDSLTILTMALSVGFIRFVSSTYATQATGSLTFPPVGPSPTEHASLSLDALWSKYSCGATVVSPRAGPVEEHGTLGQVVARPNGIGPGLEYLHGPINDLKCHDLRSFLRTQ